MGYVTAFTLALTAAVLIVVAWGPGTGVSDAREPVSVAVIEESCAPVQLEDAPTIDDLFERLLDAFRRSDEVRVDYDPDYGFPVSVGVDRDKSAMDDEYGFGAKDFEPG